MNDVKVSITCRPINSSEAKMENETSFPSLVMSSDENFDRAIRKLDMRGLISLVSKLQTEMTEEQQHFDELSKQLESSSSLNNEDYQLTSSALCASQARLALLCARNMKCFTQQAVKAKQEQATVLKVPEQLKADLSPPCPKRFQEKLLFFELQSERNNHQKEEEEEDYVFCPEEKTTLNASFSSPNLIYATDQEMGKNQTNHHTEATAANKSGPFTATCWVEDGLMCARSSTRKSRFHSLPRSTGAEGVTAAALPDQESKHLLVVGAGLSRRVKSLDDGLNGGICSNERIERVPSVEEILQIVKDLRMRHADGSTIVAPSNEKESVAKHLGNMIEKNEPIYVNVSRKKEPVYDVPPTVIPVTVNKTECIVPAATKLVLQATSKVFIAKDDDALYDCDKDSLEDEHHPPDIPSPDYGSDEDDAVYGVYDSYPGEYALTEVDSDGRLMYYPDDQILEVIVEEEEVDDEEEEEDEDYNSGPYEEKGSSMDYSSLGQSTNKSIRSSDMNGEEYEISDDSSIQRERNNGSHDSKREHYRNSVLIQSDKCDFSDSAVDLRDFIHSNGQIIGSDSIDSQDSFQLSPNDEIHFNNFSTPKTREVSKTKSHSPVHYAHVNTIEETDKKPNLRHSDNKATSKVSISPNNNNIDCIRINGSTLIETNMSEFTKRHNKLDDDASAPSLPSVKALRSQFEVKQNGNVVLPLPRNMGTFTTRRTKPPSSFSDSWGMGNGDNQAQFSQTLPIRRSRSNVRSGFDPIPEVNHKYNGKSNTLPKQAQRGPAYYPLQNGSVRTAKPIFSPDPPESPDDMIPSIIAQFGQAALSDEFSRPGISLQWDPSLLLKELYKIQSPQPTHSADASVSFINIEGYLDKLPSGRKKATFWNAWKRKFFRLKDGYLYYYQNQSSESPSLTLNLMGGHIDSMDTAMLGIDDGKGHYVVIRCCNQEETERWRIALQTHTAENFGLTYIQPVPAYPHFYEDVVIIDLGSTSVRAGILCTQPTLPQILFPTVYTIHRDSGKRVYGLEAFSPLNRSTSNLCFPLRQSCKITKQAVDLNAIAGLVMKVFTLLNVDPQDYQIQLSLPRTMSVQTQSEVLRMLFEEFEVKSVNVTAQTVLSLLSYNATSGIVVDIGERLDVIPIIDGYVVESGVAKIPYGGARIIDHLRHFLLKRHYLLMSDVDSYIVRYVLEQACYCAEKYNEELHKFYSDPESFEKIVDLRPFFHDPPWDDIVLDCGSFQAPEGIFNPDAWGLDHPGIHKLVHKAIQECSLDIRKEMTRSIYLSGGVTMLPGFAARLELEVDKLTPPSLTPKVHASPYRYHAAYLGACVLAGSTGFQDNKVTRRDWLQNGADCMRKWHH